VIRVFYIYSFRFALLSGVFVLVSGFTSEQGRLRGAETTPGPMPGCGMMIDGKMVYKNPVQGDCMTMNKPGNMMPPAVTMHSNP